MRDLLITNGTLIEGPGRTPVGMVWSPGGNGGGFAGEKLDS